MELQIGNIVRIKTAYGKRDEYYNIIRVTKTKAIGQNSLGEKEEFKRHYDNASFIQPYTTTFYNAKRTLVTKCDYVKEKLQLADVYRKAYEAICEMLTDKIQKHIEWGEIKVVFFDGEYNVKVVDNPDTYISVEKFYEKLGDRDILPKREF